MMLLDSKNNPVDILCIETNNSLKSLLDSYTINPIGRRLTEIFPFSEKLKGYINIAADVASTGKSNDIEQYDVQNNRFYRIHLFSDKKGFFAAIVYDVSTYKHELNAKQHLASLVTSSDDTMISLSLEGEILTWNEGAKQLYGYEPFEIINKPISLLVAFPEKKEYQDIIKKVCEGKKIRNFEMQHKTKSGEVISVSITNSPVFDQLNRIIGISNIVKDISAIRQREKDLIKAKEHAEQASVFKTTFLANIFSRNKNSNEFYSWVY
ncbi:MAG: PAS domain S-box protein [Bacteroidales bacterium]|nr:PAS domain S-box protein [Bacteroidales bacterium]